MSKSLPSSASIELAARLYVEAEMQSFHRALVKACEHLGEPFQAPPNYLAVEQAVINYQGLFNTAPWQALLRHKRLVALEAMAVLEDFEPRLIGALVSGALHGQTPISLMVFCEVSEWVLIALQEAAIPVHSFESGQKMKGRPLVEVDGFRFFAGDDEVRVIVLPELSLRQRPLDPVSGLPYVWMKRKALLALVGRQAADHP